MTTAEPNVREGVTTSVDERPLTATPTGARQCVCVKNHTPEPRELHRHHVWPTGEGGPDIAVNMRWLCPTSHSNAHKLWREYNAHNGRPPGQVLRMYSAYVRELVDDGWRQANPPQPEESTP